MFGQPRNPLLDHLSSVFPTISTIQNTAIFWVNSPFHRHAHTHRDVWNDAKTGCWETLPPMSEPRGGDANGDPNIVACVLGNYLYATCFLDDFGIFCLGMYCYVGHFFDFSLFVSSVNMVISQAMIIFEC